MKILKRFILAGIVIFAVVTLGLYTALKIALPPARVRALIHTQGTAALGRSVDVGDISVRIWPELKLVVSNVTVANAPGFSSDPALKLGELDLSLSLLSFLHFAPEIDQIKLVSPEILYEVNAAGHDNLEGLGGGNRPFDSLQQAQGTTVQGPAVAPATQVASPGNSPGIPVALVLKSFSIADGKIRYRDLQSGREISLGNIHQDMSVATDTGLQNIVSKGLLEIAEISVQDSALGLRKGDIHVSIGHDIQLNLADGTVKFNKLELAFQDIHAQMDGSVSHFRSKAPQVDLKISAPSIALASLLREVPANLSPDVPKLRVGGQASFQAHVQGVLDSGAIPDVDASFQIHDGTVSHSDLPLGMEHLEMDASLHRDSLRLAGLSFDMGKNPVHVQALLTSLRSKTPRLENLAVDAVLDLGGLAALAQRLGLLDRTLGVSGTESVNLKASGPLDPARPQGLSAAGAVELKGVVLTMPGKPPLRLDGKIGITNERISEQMTAKIGKSDVNVNAEVSNYLALIFPKQADGVRTHVKMDVRSGLVDLDEWLPPAGTTSGEQPGQAQTAPLQAYPPFPPVDADVTVNLAGTRLMGLEMTRFQSNTVVRAGEIRTDLKGTLYSGGFSSSVAVTSNSSTDMTIAFKLNVANVEANDFISRLNRRVPLKSPLFKSMAQQTDSLIYGRLNLGADLTTHGLPAQFADILGGTILMAVADGRIMESGLTRSFSGALSKVHSSLGFHQLSFGVLKADLKVENGNLTVRNFQMESPLVGGMQAQGRIGFDNALDLQLTQALPKNVSKEVSGATGALTGQLARLASVPQLADVSLVPMDKSGRALLYYHVGGTLKQPAFSLDAKRMAGEGAGSAKSALAAALRQKEDELKSKAQEEKQKLEAEAKSRLDTEKKKVTAQAKTQANTEVKKQGKKILKNLGF